MYSATFFSSAGLLAMQWAPNVTVADTIPTSVIAVVLVLSFYGLLYRRELRRARS